MRPSKLVALVLAAATAAVLGATGAASPARTRTLATEGAVSALSADGARVAVSTTGLAHACDRVVLWNAPLRSSARWAAHTNCGGGRQTSGGQRLTEVALAGARPLWVESISGNDQELALWSATPGHKPSMLAFATNGNGASEDPAGDYLGHVHADGTLAAFNTWRVCPGIIGTLPPICPPRTVTMQTLWRVTPGGQQSIRRRPDTTFVAAVDAGRIAVQHADGSVTLFSASGVPKTQIAIPGGRFAGLALSGNQLAVIRDGSLEVYSTATGALTKRIALPATPAPTLRDLDAGLAVYTAGRIVHVVKVATGRNRAWSTPTTTVDAQLEKTGLWYAYNRASGPAHGRVVFVPRALVAARLR
jgi:hypothetical protein